MPGYGNSMAEMILRAGENQADAVARKGQIWGQTLASLPQSFADMLQRRDVRQQLDQRNALSAAQMRNLEADNARGDRMEAATNADRAADNRRADLTALSAADTAKLEQASKRLEMTGRALAGVTDQPSYDVALSELQQYEVDTSAFPKQFSPGTIKSAVFRVKGLAQELEAMGPKLQGFGPNQTVVDARNPTAPPLLTTPPDPNMLADNVRADATAAEIERHNRAMEATARAAAGRSGDNEPLEKIVGPDGKVIYVRRRDALGKTPGAGTEKSSSGVQKKALNFFNRAQQADKDLEALEPAIQSLGLGGQARMATMPNVLQSQDGQLYTAAQRAFTEARLRKDSGAAIPEQEFANDRRTYFVQPGDTTETQAQKRRARAAILASLAFESGQALGEFVGDADEALAIIDGYKSRAARPAGKTTVGRFTVEVEP